MQIEFDQTINLNQGIKLNLSYNSLIYRMHQQQMQRMNSMMMDPFGMMGRPNVPQIQDSHRRGDHRSHRWVKLWFCLFLYGRGRPLAHL